MPCPAAPTSDGYHKFQLAPGGTTFTTACVYCGTTKTLRPFRDGDGIGRCRLVLEPKLVLTEPRPFRAFQGWRYLEVRRAPKDLDRAAPGAAAMPERLRRELSDLGLL